MGDGWSWAAYLYEEDEMPIGYSEDEEFDKLPPPDDLGTTASPEQLEYLREKVAARGYPGITVPGYGSCEPGGGGNGGAIYYGSGGGGLPFGSDDVTRGGMPNILPNILPSGDYSKPHQFVGPSGILGGSCLMCGQPAGFPIHITEPKPIRQDEIRVEVIHDLVAGDVIRIEITNPPTEEARSILQTILPGVLEAWLKKNKDYGDSDVMKALGAKAEFVRLWNKIAKLKRALWDGEKLEGEQPEEIMGDMIAHLLLALNRAGE